MTTIYLIRHAEAEGNLYRRIHGWYNALITDNGFAQIKALERRFQDVHIDAVWSSDLYRTMTTARAIYKPKGLPLHTDPELREIHMGDWEDMTWGGKGREEPEAMAAFQRCDPDWRVPNSESFQEVGDRVQRAICRIASQYPDQTIAVFSHGCAIRQLLSVLKGYGPGQWNVVPHGDNTCVTRLFYEDGALTLDPTCELDPSHMDPSIRTLAKQVWWRNDPSRHGDITLWFRPAKQPEDADFYRRASGGRELPGSDRKVILAMSGEEPVGVLELDPQRWQEDKAGCIVLAYVDPALRELALEPHLIGEAVSFFRPLGRDKLRLCCHSQDTDTQQSFAAYGFHSIGREQELDILEKYIGYDR